MGGQTHSSTSPRHRPPSRVLVLSGVVLAMTGGVAMLFVPAPAAAIGTTVDLATAGSYSVLGAQAVTNTGGSVLAGDLGVSPGTDLSGFAAATVLGAVHATDAHAAQAQSDVTAAYLDAAGQAADATLVSDIGGLMLSPGVYTVASALAMTGTVTLDGGGDPDSVFIFQIPSTLVTATGATVALVNDATSCNVFWQVGDSATLDTTTTFVGTIMALTSISTGTGTTVEGRALARTGAVTLDSTTFTRGACDGVLPPTGTGPGSGSGSGSGGTSPGDGSSATSGVDGLPPTGSGTNQALVAVAIAVVALGIGLTLAAGVRRTRARRP